MVYADPFFDSACSFANLRGALKIYRETLSYFDDDSDPYV